MAGEDPRERENGPEIATSTLAEIYAQQGLYGRALQIYRRLQRRNPEDETIAERIAELSGEAERVGEEPEPEIPVPPDAEEPGTAPAEPESTGLEEEAALTGPPERGETGEPLPPEEDEEFLRWLETK